MKCKLSRYIVVSEPLDDRDDLRSERIVYSTRTGKGIKVTDYVVGLLREGEFDDIPDRLYTILMYHEIIVPADENELDTVIRRKRLTSVDEQSRRAVLHVHDRDETAEVIHDWLPEPDAKRELVVRIEVVDVQRGLHHLQLMVNRLRLAEAGALEVDMELFVTTLHVGALVEHFPLNHPSFQRVLFHYEGDGHTLPAYLAELSRLIRQVGYLRSMPVAVQLRPGILAREQFAEVARRLSELAAVSGIQLFIDLWPAAGNAPQAQELEWIIALQQASVKASFIPAADQHFFVASTTPASPIEYREESGWPPMLWGSADRRFYSAEFSEAVRRGDTICSGCVYMPLCGGSPEKEDGDGRCPSFTQNFMKKVEYMYQFELQKP